MSKAWSVLGALWLVLGLAGCGGGGGADESRSTSASTLGERKQALAGPASVTQFAANGWYWNPAEGGTGFMFEAQGNLGFVGFFMYEEGSGKPVWYVSQGTQGSFVANADGSYTYTGDLRSFSGGQPAWSTTYVAATSISVGVVTISFNGQNASAQLPGGRTMTATRFDFNGLASTPKAKQPELGWYWNPAEGGRGYAVEVQNDRLFMAMFHYNQDGSPTWNIVEAAIPDGLATGTFILYANGQSIGSAYRPGTRHELGSFSLSFRNPCAGQIQLAGAAAVSIRRFVFGDLAAGAECRSTTAVVGDVVPGVQAGEVKMQPGDAMHGRVDAAGDVDAWGIALQAGVTYTFDLKGAGSASGTLVDPLLQLYNDTLVKVAENNNVASGQRDSRITYTPGVTGTYYLAALANGTGTGSYVLITSGVAPDLNVQPVLPVAAFAGSLSATLSGRSTGTVELSADSAGLISGTAQLNSSGITVLLTGSINKGGVFTVVSNGVGGSFSLSGLVDPLGKVAATWTDGSGSGGVAVGQSSMTPPTTTTLTVRARGSLSAGVGPTMVVRVDGVVVGTAVVSSAVPADYNFAVTSLAPGAKVDIAFTNDANANGEDRNLFVNYVTDGRTTLLPTSPGASLDWGNGDKAYDGVNVVAAQSELYSNGALRLVWPGAVAADPNLARKQEAARLLMQASFGPTPAEVNRLVAMTDAAWVAEQLAIPAMPDFVTHVQRQYDLGAAMRPGGGSYDTTATVKQFWATAATAPDQLRKRVAFALHQIMVVSQADSNLYEHTRAYANYLDTLNKHAFGNYRNLLEDIALSPVMGIYLSHIRNRKEDAATGRLPDENFAREVMQLFSIGLHELNQDGSTKLGSDGKPIETYNNADVMAMAKVFTGWSWAFPDSQLTESNFRWGGPKYGVTTDTQMDLQRMKAYPGQHSTSEKRLFAGKASAVVIPANTPAAESLRMALDALFNHPNVGPFIGRQLIQRLTTGNPSPAYVARVAGAFNNNGQGVRGDLGAVVRAILLDAEARQPPAAGFGKLKEPILRISQWMRAMGATSVTGNYLMVYDIDALSQRPYNASSVFSYFRPGYIPPNSALADAGATAPEFQIVNESTAPAWINIAENMAGSGLGWTGSARDVVPNLAPLVAMSTAGDIDGIVEQLNLLMFAGRMPRPLRQDILDAVTGVGGTNEASHRYRASVAVFIALSSPEFLVQTLMKNHTSSPGRRQFLRAAGGLSAAVAGQGISRHAAPLAMGLAGMAALSSQRARAANTSGPYRAVVCLFMNGGSDSHNWVVPIDATGYAQYAAARRELAWPQANLQPLTNSGQAAGRAFGMPVELAPIRKWYEAGRAAIVANVGPLQRPITLAEYKAGTDLPSKLFSHNDQQSTWQSLSPEGARSGWGGRMGDILMSANQQPLFTAVSATGNAVFLAGSSVVQYQVGSDGPVAARALGSTWVHGSSTAGTVLRRTLASVGDNPLQAEYTRVMQRAIAADTALDAALLAANVPAIPATVITPGGTATLDREGLARQLNIVAKMIVAGQTLGMKRQVFMVSIGGFDTHANQMRDQPVLMNRVAQSIDYFMNAMQAVNLLDNVTLFTASDFGRTLNSNGDGSDHGWGSHHYIVGGGVKGATIHGTFPVTALGTSTDVGSGRLLPGVSVTELAANLGGWMGLTRSEQEAVLPTLPAFGTRLPPMMNA